jgi:acetate kinase
MCAMLDGKSVDTTMGIAGVSGLPMATRSGDVPIDVLFYLLRNEKFDDASLEKMLYERSGLLGLSGISGDMRELEDSKDPRAAAAIDYFIYAMTKFAVPMQPCSAASMRSYLPPELESTRRAFVPPSAETWRGSVSN